VDPKHEYYRLNSNNIKGPVGELSVF
jgi:hypothetical protein